MAGLVLVHGEHFATDIVVQLSFRFTLAFIFAFPVSLALLPILSSTQRLFGVKVTVLAFAATGLCAAGAGAYCLEWLFGSAHGQVFDIWANPSAQTHVVIAGISGLVGACTGWLWVRRLSLSL